MLLEGTRDFIVIIIITLLPEELNMSVCSELICHWAGIIGGSCEHVSKPVSSVSRLAMC